MGMASMFGSGADLSGLLKSSVPLFVEDVIHKATIELNEEHTEVAGVIGNTL